MSENKMDCRLGFIVDYTVVSNKPANPKPQNSCYRPETEEDFYKAVRLNDKRLAREEKVEK